MTVSSHGSSPAVRRGESQERVESGSCTAVSTWSAIGATSSLPIVSVNGLPVCVARDSVGALRRHSAKDKEGDSSKTEALEN
jgi:hypothetical protein